MYYKVMVLEIKKDYALAMTEDGVILRIKKKEGMETGDRIYVLEEDLHQEKGADRAAMVLPFTKGRRIKKSYMHKITAAAAALMVCIASLIVPQFTAPVYAAVSFDGDSSLQVELDEKGEILDAVSFDNTVPEEELDAIRGMTLNDLHDLLKGINSGEDDIVVVGYASMKGGSAREESLEADVKTALDGQSALYLKGGKEDVEEAKEAEKSLGLYMIEKAAEEDRLEELLGDVSMAQIAAFLKKHGSAIPEEKVKAAVEEPDDEEDDDDDDDGEDDDDDDDEDQVNTPNKKKVDDDDDGMEDADDADEEKELPDEEDGVDGDEEEQD